MNSQSSESISVSRSMLVIISLKSESPNWFVVRRRLGRRVAALFSWMGRNCPLVIGRWLFSGLGWAFYSIVAIRRSTVRKQLLHHLALGSSSEASVIGRLSIKIWVSPSRGFSSWDQKVELLFQVMNESALAQAVSNEKGVLVLTAHYGNWEVLVARAGLYITHILSRRFRSDFFQGAGGC